MQIILSVISFFSSNIKKVYSYKGLYAKRQYSDAIAHGVENKRKQYLSARSMKIFEKLGVLLLTICIGFLFLICSIVFTTYAKANKPVSMTPSITSGTYSQEMPKGVWRLRVFDAAIVKGDTVMLGEIAEPLGDISEYQWQELAKKPLWAAPNQVGRPFKINKERLLGALRQYIGMYADSCILPNSLAIQKSGAVVREEDLRRIVIQRLSAQINSLGGHSDLTDYRLPSYIFVAHASQSLILEQTEVKPGRVSVRFGIQEIDGSIIRRFSGSVFLNLWVDAPALLRPMPRGAAINPADITHKSVNLAFEKGELWDGRGGPWQLAHSVGALEPLAISDLQPLAAIHKGDKVMLLYEKGSIRLSIVAEAMEDGSLGDLILVKNLDSKKQVYGMVKDQNTVISR